MNSSEGDMVDDVVTGGDTGENKLNMLIYDLLVAESWKEHVFPHMRKHLATSKGASLKAYLTLYHEATLANLLEVLMYHRTSCEEADENLIELIDYCYRKLCWLMRLGKNRPNDRSANKKSLDTSPEEDLKT